MSFWTTLRDDLLPWRWHKDDNKEAWLRRLGEAALVFTGSGMFAAPAAAETTAAAAATEAATAAAEAEKLAAMQEMMAAAQAGGEATSAGTGMFGSASMPIPEGAYTPSNPLEWLKNAPGDPGQSMSQSFKNMASERLANAVNAAKADPAGTAWGAAKGAFKGITAANAITGMFAPQPMPRGGGMSGGGGGQLPAIPEMFSSNTPKSSPGKNLDLADIDLTKLTPQELEEIKRLLAQSGIRA